METKKTTKVIAVLIAAVAFALIVTAVVLSFSNKEEKGNKDSGYKQCAKPENVGDDKTNFEHTGINYYIDKNNNRINNSEELVKKHDSQGAKLSIDKMTIESKNCEENEASMKFELTNNSEEDMANFMLIFEMKDKDGNMTHKFSMDIENLGKGETIPMEFKTISRIIDAYNYEFTYTTPGEMEG